MVVAVLDARRHEVFAARYRPVPGGVQRVSDYAVHTPAELVADLAAEPGVEPHGLLLAGDGVARFPAEFGALDHVELAGTEFAAPSVAALVELATARAEREEFELPAEVRPLYLRQSDAEIAWDRTGRRRGEPAIDGRRTRRRAADACTIQPMRRRHLRVGAARSSSRCTRVRGARRCSCPSSRCARRARTSSRASAASSSGTRG